METVKDRLATYFFWNDQQSLNQAVMVAKRNKIHLPEIKKWAKKQGETVSIDITGPEGRVPEFKTKRSQLA